MNVAIIGCGSIGKKRALGLGEHSLSWAVDLDPLRAQELAGLNPHVKVSTDFNEAINDPKVDIVIIATTNDYLTKVSLAAIKAGKHVLVEKPAARNVQEVQEVILAANASKVYVKVGFNLRFHPALMKARELIDSKVMGELMFIRGRYGHGGRLGYEKEWRADPNIAGGGELIDQGVHMIDLCRWFLGELDLVKGQTATYFWDMPVEDNAFISLSTPQGQIAWLHVSCTEWKNMFSLEIYGRLGKIQIDGLNGSYGLEKLTYYQMLPQMGPPATTVWEYPGDDLSWGLEFESFAQAIAGVQGPNGDIHDAKRALEIVEKVYARRN